MKKIVINLGLLLLYLLSMVVFFGCTIFMCILSLMCCALDEIMTKIKGVDTWKINEKLIDFIEKPWM